MNIGQIISKVAQFAGKNLGPVKKAFGSKGAALTSKVRASFTGASAMKIAGALATANVADKVVQDIPIANNIYNWWATTLDDIYGATTDKIPEVGKFLKKLRDFVNKLIVPNAQKAIEEHRAAKQVKKDSTDGGTNNMNKETAKNYSAHKHYNDPSWYTNLEMHTEFRIPMVYPDNRPLIFGSGIDTAAICVFALGFNPMADRYAIDSRLNQELDLLKAVRGLSGRLPYSRGDLFYYHLITYYLVNEYYKLKFAIRASNLYIMTKSRMPRNLIEEMGWDFDDLLQNKALYITLLTNIANFIQDSVPMFGTQLDKIASMWDSLIPDCDDGKVALYYKFYPMIDGYLPSVDANGVITYERFGDKFYDFTPDKGATDTFEQCGRAYSMTYSTYATNVLSFMRKVLDNEIFVNIKADIIGAFGSSAIYRDKNFKTYADSNILGKFDELILTVIQNATIVEERPYFYNNNTSSVEFPTASRVYYTLRFGGVNAQGTCEMPYAWAGSEDNTYVGVEYEFYNPNGDPGAVDFPAIDGRTSGHDTGSTSTFTQVSELTVIANKYTLSEGEALEINQLSALDVSDNGHLDFDGAAYSIYARHFLTQSFYVLSADILYHSNHTDRKVRLAGYALPNLTSPAVQAETTEAYTAMQFWSQSDYMSKLHFTFVHGAPAVYDDRMLLDYNIMGSISSEAFRQAIRYSTYSVYAPALRVTESRKINNVVEVYNSK